MTIEKSVSIEAVVEAEDRVAGRVIPKWRYWSAYCLIAVAGIWGSLVARAHISWWVSLIEFVTIFYAYILLLGKYKRRSIG